MSLMVEGVVDSGLDVEKTLGGSLPARRGCEHGPAFRELRLTCPHDRGLRKIPIPPLDRRPGRRKEGVRTTRGSSTTFVSCSSHAATLTVSPSSLSD